MKMCRGKGFEKLCQALADADYEDVIINDYFESLCLELGEAPDYMEFCLYESFGMSSSEIIEALCDI